MEKEGNTPSNSLLSTWNLCVLVSLRGICGSFPIASPSKPLGTQYPSFWRPQAALPGTNHIHTSQPSPSLLIFLNKAVKSYGATAESYGNPGFSSQNSKESV